MVSKWDKHWLERAEAIAQMSKDPSTKCGAVIVREYPNRAPKMVSEGYNGFPPGCDDSPAIYADREEKLGRVMHAEVNAIIAAEQSVRGCTMYTFPGGVGPSCDRCTAAIIQAGIIRVVHYYEPPVEGTFNDRWAESIKRGLQMYSEAGVQVDHVLVPDERYELDADPTPEWVVDEFRKMLPYPVVKPGGGVQ